MSRIHHQQFDGGISGSAPFSLSSLFLSLSLSRARRARASRASQIANEPRAAARSPRGRGLELRFIWRTYDGQRSSASRAAHRHRNQGVIPRSSAAAVTSSDNMALFSAAPPGKRALPPRPVARLSARLRRAAAPPLSEKPRLPRDVRPANTHTRAASSSLVSRPVSRLSAHAEQRRGSCLAFDARNTARACRPASSASAAAACRLLARGAPPRRAPPQKAAPQPPPQQARERARTRARGVHGALAGVFVLLCLCVFLSSVVSCLGAFAIAARSAIASALHDAAPARRPLRRPLCHGHVPHEPGRMAVQRGVALLGIAGR